MNNEELREWQVLQKDYNNGIHLSKDERRELLRLNHLVMEVSHEIHNSRMIDNFNYTNL